MDDIVIVKPLRFRTSGNVEGKKVVSGTLSPRVNFRRSAPFLGYETGWAEFS